MGLIGIRLNIGGGAFAADLTKALSYLTGSHVPSGSSVNVVGIDYDSPHNNADSATESMYLAYYPVNDKLVSAWRNGFAAHCNAREDLNIMGSLGEFVVGWGTSSIEYPGDAPTGWEQTTGSPGLSPAHFEEEAFYNWASLECNISRTYVVAAATGTRPGIIAESRFFCHSGIDNYDGVIVGSYADGHTYKSKFAIGGDTSSRLISGSQYSAKIGLIDAYNKANPVNDNKSLDAFGFSEENIKKYGYNYLNDIPMVLKIQTGMSTHFTIPVGGINVMCGLLRLSDTWTDIAVGTSNPPDEHGGDSANSGTLTVWVSGWNEF